MQGGRSWRERQRALVAAYRFIELPQIVKNASELAERFDDLGARRDRLPRRAHRVLWVFERARCNRELILSIGELDRSGEVAARRPGLALGPEHDAQSEMSGGVTGVEGDCAPTMDNGLVEALKLGQGDREIEMGVGVVRAGLGCRLEFLCRGGIRPLPQQCQTEPEMRQRRARLERQRPPEATGRLLRPMRFEIGVAQIAVIGGDAAIYRDRLAKKIDRPEMISFLARDDPQHVERRVVTRR